MRTRLQDQWPTLLVATLAGTFGVMLLHVTGLLAAAIAADDVTGTSDTVAIMLMIVAGVFIVIAIYVSAIVTANTVATVVAGRTRLIALLRLIGSSAQAERARIAKEGLLVGLAGAALGIVLGTAVAFGLQRVAVATGLMPETAYDFVNAVVVLPAVAVVLTTWLASWVGSRRVLSVRPAQAIGAATEHDREEIVRRRGRHVTALVLVVSGTALLAGGVVLGLVMPLGVFVAMIGGIVSFTGIVLAAQVVMPPVLRLVGRLLGASPAARLAAENAVRHPERSSRMTIGLVIGVTLVTTFSVTMESYRALILTAQEQRPDVYLGIDEMLNVTIAVFSVLIGFSALIAALGLVNTLSLSVLQRTRELGLLRALGFDRAQLRWMIVAEAAALTVSATLAGLVLGFVYGWAGAQSLLGTTLAEPGLVLPGVPWAMFGILAVAAALLTLVASIGPARRAMRVSPVVALATD
ncbi:ABC transporter permease [Agromyces aerolatus]|uniref:ABC transporter permease n=1 Tax=Agromyces sp. LY-1074 TaxID=3074080 RepID=UPI0028646C7E|nr:MULTISPECIES: FtsX-like permease family protein [unclassified Agromyces]MDR5700236.1 FtsX-like permease family protein [Agromyces sp. LY-1074]MDR5706396.1 FtsX-like permease family protein [Agromyces sp. LY-1358]